MTQRRFYLFAGLLPLIAPLAAALIALPTLRSQPDVVSAPVKAAFLVFLVGIYSTIPYLLFLIAVWLRFRSRTNPPFTRLAWFAPMLIAIVFAPAFAVTTGSGGGPAEFVRACIVGAAWAIAVGYVYVIVIETVRAAALSAGWVTH